MREEDLYLGFPVPPLIRFVGEEEAFLSNANGGPRMFLNIEDHQSYQTGKPNLRFDVSPSLQSMVILFTYQEFDQFVLSNC